MAAKQKNFRVSDEIAIRFNTLFIESGCASESSFFESMVQSYGKQVGSETLAAELQEKQSIIANLSADIQGLEQQIADSSDTIHKLETAIEVLKDELDATELQSNNNGEIATKESNKLQQAIGQLEILTEKMQNSITLSEKEMKIVSEVEVRVRAWYKSKEKDDSLITRKNLLLDIFLHYHLLQTVRFTEYPFVISKDEAKAILKK
jgi:TolA-binding protein